MGDMIGAAGVGAAVSAGQTSKTTEAQPQVVGADVVWGDTAESAAGAASIASAVSDFGRPASRRSILGVFDDMAATAIAVHQERCAKVRNRNVSCLRCAEACTSGCIALVDERLSVDSSKCVGCGTCATVCPTCALEARNPTDAELASSCQAARVGDSVEIACSLVMQACEGLLDERRIASVVCAGRLDESLLAALAESGIEHISIACGRCSACAQRQGIETARLVADTANALFAAWGSSARARVHEGVSSQALAPEVSIDDARAALDAFFSEPRSCPPISATACDSREQSAASEAKAKGAAQNDRETTEPFSSKSGSGLLAQGLTHVMADGTLPHFIPNRRERLLDSLSALGEPQVASLETRLWGYVVIDGTKCSSCRMCATFCPTGAIAKFDDADGSFGVKHYPGDCVKCGSCRDICPEDAIVILDAVKPDFLLGGSVHRYAMKPREVQLNDPHQILNTMKTYLGDQTYER